MKGEEKAGRREGGPPWNYTDRSFCVPVFLLFLAFFSFSFFLLLVVRNLIQGVLGACGTLSRLLQNAVECTCRRVTPARLYNDGMAGKHRALVNAENAPVLS